LISPILPLSAWIGRPGGWIGGADEKNKWKTAPSIGHTAARFPAVRDRISRLLRCISLVLGRTLDVGPPDPYPLGLTNRIPDSQGSAGRKSATGVDGLAPAKYYGCDGLSTSKRKMAKSAMWPDLSWTTKPGPSATSKWPLRNWWPGKKVLVSPAWIQKSKLGGVQCVCPASTGMRSRLAPTYVDSVPNLS